MHSERAMVLGSNRSVSLNLYISGHEGPIKFRKLCNYEFMKTIRELEFIYLFLRAVNVKNNIQFC